MHSQAKLSALQHDSEEPAAQQLEVILSCSYDKQSWLEFVEAVNSDPTLQKCQEWVRKDKIER